MYQITSKNAFYPFTAMQKYCILIITEVGQTDKSKLKTILRRSVIVAVWALILVFCIKNRHRFTFRRCFGVHSLKPDAYSSNTAESVCPQIGKRRYPLRFDLRSKRHNLSSSLGGGNKPCRHGNNVIYPLFYRKIRRIRSS